MEGLGDCYEAAFKLIDEFFLLPARLCHGIATGTGCGIEGVRYGHAWVEIHSDSGFIVLDYSNNKRLVVPGHIYYEAGTINLDEVIRYTREEARLKVMAFDHFGYWDSVFEEVMYRQD